MANQVTVSITAGQLPNGFCPATYQDILNGFVLVMTGTFPNSFTGVIAQQTKPTDQTQIWKQLDSLGRPIRDYIFSQGAWISLHPTPPGMVMIWPTALPDFTTFDGGDNNAPGPYSGPMWQQLTGLNAAVPLGAGTLPSGTVVAAGGTGGEEKHTLLTTEMPSHTHPTNFIALNVSAGTLNITAPPNTVGTNTGAVTGATGGDPGNSFATVPHNTMPPYYGVYFLQRTNRLFYTVN